MDKVEKKTSVKKKKKSNRTSYVLPSILIAILMIAFGFFVTFMMQNEKKVKTDLTTTKKTIVTTTMTTTKTEEEQIDECLVDTWTFGKKPKTSSEKAYVKLNRGFNKEKDFIHYFYEQVKIDSANLSDEAKLQIAISRLGLQYENDKKCFINKQKVDDMVVNTFKEPIKEYPSVTKVYNFDVNYEIDKERFIVGVSEEGYRKNSIILDEIYDEKIEKNKLTFKTKFLEMYISGNKIEITYYKENNINKENLNIPDDFVFNEDKILNKYSEYSNLYEWTFIKNKKDEYVFDNVARLK